MSLTNNLWRFALSLKLMLAAFVVCVIAFGYYITARNEVRVATQMRYHSQLLTEELRQSSDDLTRMVRTYVATKDLRYRDQFDEVLAIRDGKAPRPEEYENIYWDLVLDDRRPTRMGPPSSLLQRMSEAGFTTEELNMLTVAKGLSDTLATIEHQAMALLEAGDATSDVISMERHLQAISMLHDAAYHRAKADIMRPIAEATRMVNMRTAAAVEDANQHALDGLVVFTLAGMVLVIVLWWTQRNLHMVFGGSVAQLRKVVVTNGDVPKDVAPGNGDKDSIIGKLIDAQHERASDEKRRQESERRMRGIVGALDEGVCVVQDALIRFVNDKLQKILAIPEMELLDRPFIQFVRADEREALMERYRDRVAGVPMEPTNMFHLNSGLKVISKATEFEWSGRPATLVFINMAEATSGG